MLSHMLMLSKKLDINGELVGLDNDSIKEGQKLEFKIISIKMGGAGHIHLLYDCVRLLKVKNVIQKLVYLWMV